MMTEFSTQFYGRLSRTQLLNQNEAVSVLCQLQSRWISSALSRLLWAKSDLGLDSKRKTIC